MNPIVGVITFPGSNGDHDALYSLEHDLGYEVRAIDYRETDLGSLDAVVLPGGFAYGDALRCGAIARFAPVMGSVREFAEAGNPVLGICNGFQVLCEAHLLPGALLRNASLQFHCFTVNFKVEQADTAWTRGVTPGEILTLPVAHGEGSYFIEPDRLAELERNRQIVARYVDANGNRTAEANPNGSVASIAAICNAGRNVVGLMPHPERATNALVGGDHGLRILRSLVVASELAAAS
ncbi:MAG TPA: phosphoribosylformylglycinamidine synthase subunit PurQ [Thermomicrobiales bacterium]|nr:phosphoribosylformylglycinamidine synthase subunit PurQ [Thermomicrobiales bacterium]